MPKAFDKFPEFIAGKLHQ